MAVEPRKIEEPTPKTTGSALAALEKETAAEAEAQDGSGKSKGGLPLIPIIAGIVGLIVLGLLAKVVMAK